MAKEVIQSTVLVGATPLALGANAQVTIRDADSAALVNLWTDRDGDSSETNPFNADANGQFTVYADPNRLQITVVAGGETRIWEDFQLVPSARLGGNKIINGAVAIDQRDSDGSPITTTDGYGPDRWHLDEGTGGSATIERVATAPAGFEFSCLVTSTGADTSIGSGEFVLIEQRIEGLNILDYDLGESTAVTFTLSFWVRSSLAGTYCVAFRNSARNRSYVSEYTINSPDTWEKKTVTVVGDTTGTWLKTNGVGLRVSWALAIGSDFHGTNNTWEGANDISTSNQVNWMNDGNETFYLTGVKVEIGPKATQFDHRLEEAESYLCKNYFERYITQSNGQVGSAMGIGTTTVYQPFQYRVIKRAIPTVTVGTAADGSDFGLWDDDGTVRAVTSFNTSEVGIDFVRLQWTSGTTMTAGTMHNVVDDGSANAFIDIDAEL